MSRQPTARAPSALPPLNAATLLRALFKRPRRPAGLPVPHTRYLLARLDPVSLRRYRDQLGFAGDAIPLTWWYLPAQRAQLATMLDDAFPFRLPGAVHTANLLRAGAAPDPDAPLLLDTRVSIAPPSEHGAVRALLDTVGTQDGRTVFECSSTYLMVRGQPNGGGRGRPADTPLPAQAAWQVGAASGRRYAALSGDWNPIHLWPWSARLMGMRRPIIHGMHSLARACAELERLHGRRVHLLDARFLAPVALGSEVQLGAEVQLHDDPAGGRFTLACEGRVAVGGTVGFADPTAHD